MFTTIWFVVLLLAICLCIYLPHSEFHLMTNVKVHLMTNVKEWEHGYETERVRATRYRHDAFGFNIGLTFPRNPYDCDRPDMMKWLRDNDFCVFQCGGYPGAEVIGKVKGVNSKEEANEWLPTFLPKLDAWVKENLR